MLIETEEVGGCKQTAMPHACAVQVLFGHCHKRVAINRLLLYIHDLPLTIKTNNTMCFWLHPQLKKK